MALFVAACSAGSSEPASGTRAASKTPREFRQIRWGELVPPGWDPYVDLRDKDLARVIDGTPRAEQRMRALREIWDNAPTNDQMNGQDIKLPGYIVPLEETKDGMKEFLLVPYFGACIHSPPPPANQIVHVFMARRVKGYSAMDTVWVSGTLTTARRSSDMGVSGYRIDAASLERYAPLSR